MKSSLFSKIIFATLALALTTGAFAANDSHKSSFEISAPTQVNGKRYPPATTQPSGKAPGPMSR